MYFLDVFLTSDQGKMTNIVLVHRIFYLFILIGQSLSNNEITPVLYSNEVEILSYCT